MLFHNSFVTTSLVAAAIFGGAEAGSHRGCSLTRFHIENSTSIAVSHHSKGEVLHLTNTVESCEGPAYKTIITNDLCRVVVNVTTSATSTVRLEAWLPDEWNGRLLAVGTGEGGGGLVDVSIIRPWRAEHSSASRL
jgi:hypothetical protein